MADQPDKAYVSSYEDVRMFSLDNEREERLLNTQTECTFMWTTKEGILAKLDAISVDQGKKDRFKLEMQNLKISKQPADLFEIPKGVGVPTRHVHASNQFMYCVKGEYEYLSNGLVLKPGSFYMNPQGHPHGPTIAHERSVLIEIYDGPHYYEKPMFHTDQTIGDFLAKPT